MQDKIYSGQDGFCVQGGDLEKITDSTPLEERKKIENGVLVIKTLENIGYDIPKVLVLDRGRIFAKGYTIASGRFSLFIDILNYDFLFKTQFTIAASNIHTRIQASSFNLEELLEKTLERLNT